ncbi:trypsin-like serine protease [Pseudoclavibacter sp. CFCC 13796]|uniref:trypsin-like serine protease n=1 Tax=Pseudoclavibacter sp. CFCC 13796 TaxID=2615179 RepID=UPI001300E554|nr:trypsin-like serine protease [Pseudoclavibacter sp. CFCC 13796]KAB1661652.1 trypsin-like serine protease [Pseudoclavibacter sp. CFCC 13796]
MATSPVRRRQTAAKIAGAIGVPVALAVIGGMTITPANAEPAHGTAATAQALIAQVQAAGDSAGSSALMGAATDSFGRTVAFVNDSDSDAGALRSSIDGRNAAGADIQLVSLSGELHSAAASTLVGGAGTGITLADGSGYVCSVGFPAWSKAGKPAFISAGHCYASDHNAEVWQTKPSSDTASGTGQGYYDPVEKIGTVGFTQFGGPGDTKGADGDTSSIDISAVDVTNTALTPRPLVTDWTTAAGEDLSASATPVKSVGAIDPSQPVKRSGRTTGMTAGDVTKTADGAYITDGWMLVDDHFVRGFGITAKADHGDSGGPIVQGDRAVGVVSAIGTLWDGTPLTWGASLVDSLPSTGGYTVAQFVDVPQVSTVKTGDTIGTGSTISGTGQPGDDISATFTGVPDVVKATVAADGTWSVAAPNTPGEYGIAVHATRGFDSSDTLSITVKVATGAPAITSPSGVVTDTVREISGTGVPGATVSVTGDVTATATVADDGSWSVSADLGYGNHQVKATQVYAGQTSAETTASFRVAPEAPVITTPADGSVYSDGSAPTAVNGTGLPGAAVTVEMDGRSTSTTVADDGSWSVPVTVSLAGGQHVISATQSVNGSASAAVQTTITVNAPAAPSAPGDQQGPAESGDTPTGEPVPVDAQTVSGTLAQTGAGRGVIWAAGAGITALIAGAALSIRGALKARRLDS